MNIHGGIVASRKQSGRSNASYMKSGITELELNFCCMYLLSSVFYSVLIFNRFNRREDCENISQLIFPAMLGKIVLLHYRHEHSD